MLSLRCNSATPDAYFRLISVLNSQTISNRNLNLLIDPV